MLRVDSKDQPLKKIWVPCELWPSNEPPHRRLYSVGWEVQRCDAQGLT
jgi:hypothetical protein